MLTEADLRIYNEARAEARREIERERNEAGMNDVKSARKRLREIEDQIGELISVFAKEYGAHITSIHIDSADIRTFAESEPRMLQTVRCRAEL